MRRSWHTGKSMCPGDMCLMIDVARPASGQQQQAEHVGAVWHRRPTRWGWTLQDPSARRASHPVKGGFATYWLVRIAIHVSSLRW